MTKIADLIQFHGAMGTQVRLHDHYYEEAENRERLTGYMPIRSHRQAFLELAGAQLPDRSNKDKVFMLTGSFGTGKSHLLLMMANYFARKANAAEMQRFFDNWQQRDPEGAARVRNMRGDGRYLTVICEYGGSKPFEDMVLSGVEEALQAEGAEEVTFENYYKGALRLIQEWEQRRASGERVGVLEDFLHHLDPDDPETALEDLKQALGANDSHAYEQFQATYQKATGQRYTMRNDNLVDALRDLVRNPAFKARFRGLVVLADEFGYALREGRVKMSVFQEFAEMSKDGVDGMPIIFIGAGHMRFAAYSESIPADKMDFQVVSDRVTEVSLESAELEQIIAALISPKKEDAIWKQEVQTNYRLTQLANETKSEARKVKLFDMLSAPEVLDQIVLNIYPMHPLAVKCLINMAQDLGSDARSVVSFFRLNPKAEGGSYQWFVQNTELKNAQGDLNFYTPELLIEFFNEKIVSTNLDVRPEIHDQIRNYLAATESAEQIARSSTMTGEVDPFIRRVLNLIFVLRISAIPVNYENLLFGLNLIRPEDKKRLENELKQLKDNGIIFQAAGAEFELRRSNMRDVDTEINLMRSQVMQRPLDAADKLGQLADKYWQIWTEATGHNAPYSSDRRLLRVFATPNDLQRKSPQIDGSEISFWQKLENARQDQTGWNERYEGVMVYVLCETQEDILNAQQIVRSNPLPTIIVGISAQPIPVKDILYDYLAVQEYMTTQDYQKLDPQEKALVSEVYGKETQRQGRVGALIKVRERYLDARELVWYQRDGRVLLNQPTSAYEPADALMTQSYKKRNTAEHTILNIAHPKFQGSKDNALREAVSRLLDLDHPVMIDANEKESQGEIRYLRNVLVKNQVLVQTGDFSSSLAPYELNTNIEAFKTRLPALFELVERLRELKPSDRLSIWPLLNSYTEAPFGLGPYALSLFLAVAVRYLGDELRLKLQPQLPGYSPLDDPERLIELATGKSPNAIFERRMRTAATTELIDGIYAEFSETPAHAGEHSSLTEAWQAIQQWWRKRTRLERTPAIYPDDGSAQKLIDMLTRLESAAGASQMFMDDLKQVYGYSSEADLDETQAQALLAALIEDRMLLETHVQSIKDRLLNDIGRLFAPEGQTYLDYTTAINDWVNALHSDQKDPYAAWQDKASQTLLEGLPKIVDIERTLLTDIPAAPGFAYGKVDDWGYDRSDDYLDRFSEAINRINNGLPTTQPPEWETDGELGVDPQGRPVVQFHGTITLQVSAPEGATVRVTKDIDPKTASQFEPVTSGQTWSCQVTDSAIYNLVSQNEQGDFSKVIKIQFRNLDDNYRLLPDQQGALFPENRFYSFRNPTDRNGLVALLRDLLIHLTKDDRIPPEDIATAVQEALAAAGLPTEMGSTAALETKE